MPGGRLVGRQSCLSACEGGEKKKKKKEREGAMWREMERVGGGVHLLTSSWLESWRWYKAAERNLSARR